MKHPVHTILGQHSRHRTHKFWKTFILTINVEQQKQYLQHGVRRAKTTVTIIIPRPKPKHPTAPFHAWGNLSSLVV